MIHLEEVLQLKDTMVASATKLMETKITSTASAPETNQNLSSLSVDSVLHHQHPHTLQGGAPPSYKWI